MLKQKIKKTIVQLLIITKLKKKSFKRLLETRSTWKKTTVAVKAFIKI